MDDLPHAAGLAQTQRIAEPDIRLRTVGSASRQVDQRMAKRDVFAGGDAKLRDREADLAPPAGEPVLQSLGIIAEGSQRRSKIELNQIISPVRHYSVGVLGPHGFRPSLHHRPDLGLGRFDNDLVRHDAAPVHEHRDHTIDEPPRVAKRAVVAAAIEHGRRRRAKTLCVSYT